jgi:hypothetical protein
LYPIKEHLARWGREKFHAYGEMIRIINHGLGGLKETRVIGCESYFENQMEEQSRIYAKSTTLASAYGNLPRFVLEPLIMSFLIGFTFLFIALNIDETAANFGNFNSSIRGWDFSARISNVFYNKCKKMLIMFYLINFLTHL